LADHPIALPARRLGGRVRAALADPLYRSGYALVINTAGTTVIGVVYWAVAAHLYSQRALGRASALVSALLLVSALAQLNMGNVLPRFLPLAFRRSGRLIGYGYATTSVAAAIAATAFVLVMPLVNAQWRFLGASAWLAIGFAAATVLWGIFALEDAALTGLRHAGVVPVENTVYGVLKLLLLVEVARLLPSTGIFVSWIVPLVVIIPVINVLIVRRYLRQGAARVGPGDIGARVSPRDVIRFAYVDYIGNLLGQIYTNLLPLLVLSILGAAANGTFYVAWTITMGLVIVATNFATSLLVEGTSAPERLPELTRGILKRCMLIVTLGVVLLIAAARPVLSIYGSKYAADASSLLGLLALGVLPRSLVVIAFSLDRIAGKVGRATLTNVALTILVLGGSWTLLTRIGIEGVAIAWCGANFVIAIVRLPTIIRAAARRGKHAAVPAPAPAPVTRRSAAASGVWLPPGRAPNAGLAAPADP
jgi:O-antigen/teichoic acid export membrane protein